MLLPIKPILLSFSVNVVSLVPRLSLGQCKRIEDEFAVSVSGLDWYSQDQDHVSLVSQL
jgi:hypothetical protein